MRTRFPVRWRGYDRAAVDQFLAQFASDYDRLQSNLAYLDQLTAKKDVKGTLAAAREEADEIRLAAERESASLIRQAKDRAEQLIHERLKATQRESERLAELARDLAPALESALAVIRRAEEGIRSHVPTEHEPPAPVHSRLGAQAPASPRGSAHSARTVVLIAIALLVVTIPVTTAFYFWSGPSPIPPVPSVHLATAPPAPVSPRSDTAPSKGEYLVDAADPSPARDAAVGSSADAAASSLSPTVKNGLTVVLRAHGSSWVRAMLDGGRAAEHMLNAGAEITLQAENDVLLRVGNAGAISMTVNGRATDPLGRVGQVVTRRITRTNDGTSPLR
jgi:DivIVA domain-containing protein